MKVLRHRGKRKVNTLKLVMILTVAIYGVIFTNLTRTYDTELSGSYWGKIQHVTVMDWKCPY